MALDRLQALDGAEILPIARSTAWLHEERRPLCVVLLHSLTSTPAQFATFAPLLHERGWNAIAVRLPRHGERNRMTANLAGLRTHELLVTLDAALEIAHGLGERVAIMGHSTGGVLASYAAQFREGIELAVPVCPGFAVLRYSRARSRMLMAFSRVVPNRFIWWDTKLREDFRPSAAYPRFATRAVAAVMRVADATYDAAGKRKPLAARIRAVGVAGDPAVNNSATAALVQRWRSHGADASYSEIVTEPLNHDIFDSDQPRAQTERTYPPLLAIFDELFLGVPRG